MKDRIITKIPNKEIAKFLNDRGLGLNQIKKALLYTWEAEQEDREIYSKLKENNALDINFQEILRNADKSINMLTYVDKPFNK